MGTDARSAPRAGRARAGFETRSNLGEILDSINGLHSVYTRLFVYDSQGRILVSSSRDGAASVAGERIDEDTLAAVLALRSEQQYHVTPFRPDPLYDVRPTYVYHAAIRDPGTDAGGIGIVFDAEAEFSAMLQGALGGTDNASALFIDRGGRVVASTDRTRPVGSRIELDPQLLALDNGRHASRVVEHDGQYAVMACCASSGYRDDVLALVFIACRGFESPLSAKLTYVSAIRC